MIMLEYNSVTFMLCTLCGILLIIQLIYIWGIYNRMNRASKKQSEQLPATDCPPISVILVTKDSGVALQENLPAILEQDYPNFEVIVVNDESAGEDENILKLLENNYKNLYHTFIPKTARYISRKKLGISMGIKASRYNWIVVTDPYSRPASKHWLYSLSRHFTPETEIVLGYSNFTSDNSSFARHIITDTLFQSMRFLGRALGGRAYMGMGHNMAYRKDFYELHKGFSKQLNLKRGEDDLFVNAVATQSNTKVALSPDSIVRRSMPPFRHIWKTEKISYAVTGHYYRGNARLFNALETWTCALFHLSILGGISMSIIEQQWILTGIIGLIWAIRFVSAMVVFKKTATAMGEDLCCYLPVYDLFRPWYSFTAKMRYVHRTRTDYIRK